MIKFLIFSVIFTLGMLSVSAEDTIYHWTDENKVKHYTNQNHNLNESDTDNLKTLEPGETSRFKGTRTETYQYDTEQIESEQKEYEKEQEILKEFWQSRMKALDDRIAAIEEEIRAIETRMEYLDNEIDYLLINGYSADYLIFELRTLENSVEPLKEHISLIEEEKEQLRTEARKKGIPPGYLRY